MRFPPHFLFSQFVFVASKFYISCALTSDLAHHAGRQVGPFLCFNSLNSAASALTSALYYLDLALHGHKSGFGGTWGFLGVFSPVAGRAFRDKFRFVFLISRNKKGESRLLTAVGRFG